MEVLLTILIWLWQFGWIVLLGGGLCAAAVWLIRPLRKRKKLTFAVCLLTVILLLAVLCVRPVVLGNCSAEEKEQARQLAAGPYSNRVPVTPVCAVVEKGTDGMSVRVWYAFAGSMTYSVGSDGLPSITDWLGPWE